MRQQIDSKDREIRSLFKEMSLHNKGINELRDNRDDLNKSVKELRATASDYRNKRDEVNKKIAELKQQRNEMLSHQSTYTDKIGEMKKTRDDLNKIARGRIEFLNKTYEDQLDKFSNIDIPLEYEQSLFENLHELSGRLEAIHKANIIHNEIGDVYGKVSEFKHDLDTISALIRDLASESQENHLKMLEIYKEVDDTKKESDDYHQRLVEIYKITRPIKDKIDVLKKSLSAIREELDSYLEHMSEIQLDKDKTKEDTKRIAAKEKFDKSGRMSLEDLRLLIENDEIKFEKES
ncbi:MAG: phosphoserine phosphatase [Candidatus Methanomarinus sp.]|uniref:Phosphoserine phosphatase n=1 Tax=Candidatus Methanomarinus sp. TaxID=3386244 RepID=A0AC61SCB7_9EURY|nr:MAG: phosphoserine phosphatase [ANME-2 cluster archaeon]